MLTVKELRAVMGRMPDDAPVVVREIFSPDPMGVYEVDAVRVELRPRDPSAINGSACNHLILEY